MKEQPAEKNSEWQDKNKYASKEPALKLFKQSIENFSFGKNFFLDILISCSCVALLIFGLFLILQGVVIWLY
jgi:hypothetical protein